MPILFLNLQKRSLFKYVIYYGSQSSFACNYHTAVSAVQPEMLKDENTVVDQEAQDTLDSISNCSIPYTNFKPFIMKNILKQWQYLWDQEINRKLMEKK